MAGMRASHTHIHTQQAQAATEKAKSMEQLMEGRTRQMQAKEDQVIFTMGERQKEICSTRCIP